MTAERPTMTTMTCAGLVLAAMIATLDAQTTPARPAMQVDAPAAAAPILPTGLGEAIDRDDRTARFS